MVEEVADFATRTGRVGPGAPLLLTVLRLDAAASAALGAVVLAGGAWLDGVLGLPAWLLWSVGAFLLGYGACLLAVASRRDVHRPSAWGVVAANAAWVGGSVAVVAGGWFPLTAVGVAVVLAQAVAVLLLADLQVLGLWRARRASATVG